MSTQRKIAGQKRSKMVGMVILISALLISSPIIAEPVSGKAAKLLEALQTSDTHLQPDIVREIEAMGDTAVPSLIDSMNSSDKAQRHQAIEILGRIGQDADTALPRLMEALKDPEAQIRRNAAWAIGRVGGEPGDIMPALLDTATDIQWDVRADAVWAMGKVVENQAEWDALDSDLVASIMAFLDDHSLHVRWSAAWSLARFGPGAESALQSLVDTLEDDHAKVRASAASALGRIASSHHEELVGEALSKAMNDESPLVRSRASAALQSLRSRTVPSF